MPVGLAANLTFAAGVPSVLSPLCFVVVLPLLFLNDARELTETTVRALAFVLSCSVYGAWCLPAAFVAPRIPLGSTLLAALIALAAALWTVGSAAYGVKYQGLPLVLWYLFVDTVVLTTLFLIARRNSRAPSAKSFAMFHVLFFCWFFWGSIPWLGELI